MRAVTMMVAVAALAGTSVGTTSAAVVSIPASRDATLYFSANGSLANGAGETTFVGRNSQGNTRRTLLGFDIASMVPAGSTITGVTLTLNVSSANAPSTNVDLHRLTSDWSEGPTDPANDGQGAASQAGDTTWLHRSYPDVLWTTPGGDFASAISATTAVGGLGLYQWSSSGMISDVQSWLDAPGGNFGWALLGDEINNSSAKRFDSRTIGTAGIAPVLEVTYIPTPGAGALMAGAALVGLRRRR